MGDVLRGVSPARIFARPTAETAWLGPAQRSALSHLTSERPCKILSGPKASGRSLLLARLEPELGSRATVIGISGARLRAGSLLATVLDAAGVARDGLDARERCCRLAEFATQRRAAGSRVVITVDDADRLTPGAAPELAWLAALCERTAPILELTVSALPGGGSTPASISWPDGLDHAVHALGWLSADDVEAYITWRLEQFELGRLFTRPAVHLITRCTQGRFPAIDVLSQMALLLMRHRDAARVDVTLIDEAVSTLTRRRALTELEQRAVAPPCEQPRRLAAAPGDSAAPVETPRAPRERVRLRLVK